MFGVTVFVSLERLGGSWAASKKLVVSKYGTSAVFELVVSIIAVALMLTFTVFVVRVAI